MSSFCILTIDSRYTDSLTFPPAVGVFDSGQRSQLILTKVLQIGKWLSENNLVIILLSQDTFFKKFSLWVVGLCRDYSNMVRYGD